MKQHTIRRRGLIGAAGALAVAHAWPARTDEIPIVIGQSGHLSGPLAPSFKGTLAGQRIADKQVPLVGVYTGSPALRAKHHPYFFTTMASYRDEVVKMVEGGRYLR
jgi:hypothetical protein